VIRNGRPAALVLLLLAALLGAALPAAAAPPPDTTVPDTTATTVPAPAPPPPPVTLPPTARIAALGTAARVADGAVADATARRAGVQADITAAEAAVAQADAASSALNVAASRAAARYDASRAELRRVAVATYMQAGNAGSTIDAWVNSGDLLEAGRRQQLLDDAGEARQQVVDQARADRIAAARAAAEAEADRRHKRARLGDVEAELQPAQQALVDAQATANVAHVHLARWQSVALGTATPILGAPAVTGDDLAAWFEATRRPARITVPIQQLTALFISEGQAEGVRGDIAFAQSILETGSLTFPDGGLVGGTDNNFAGIGACDSCPHGHIYPDAQTGVRVQMQYLHVYADPTMTAARFAHPPVDPNMDHNFRKGQAPTWNGLTHTWATADAYGDRILAIYYQILDWLTQYR